MQSARAWREKLRSPVVRNAAYLIATEAVGGVLGLAFWALAARSFRDADIGVGAILVTSATLLALLSTLGFNVGLIRFLPERQAPPERLINSSVTIGVAVSVALAVGFALGAGRGIPVLGFLGSEPVLLVLFVLFCAVWTMSLLLDASFVALGDARPVFLRAVVYNALKIPLPLALALALGSAFALFAAWGIGLLVANVLAVVLLLRRLVPSFRLRPDLDRTSVGPMVRFSFQNHITNVLGAVPGLVFPLLVANVLLPEDAAYFYVAWVLANFLFLVPGSIFTSVFAESSRWLLGLRGNAVDGLFLSIAILVPGVAAVWIAGPWVLAALKPTFLVAVPALNVLAASAFFVAVNVLYVTVLRVRKRMRPVIAIYAGTTLGALALSVLFMPQIGLLGAALAFAIAHGGCAVYSAWAMLREGVLRKPA